MRSQSLRFAPPNDTLGKPRFKMFKTAVRPFMNDYLITVLRARDRLMGKAKRYLKELDAHYDNNLIRLTGMLIGKWEQLAKHAQLVEGAIPR